MPSTGSTTTFPGYTDRSGVGQSVPGRVAGQAIDVWSADFLGRHPDAVVAHLGCGLDTRAFRLQPPDGVQWFDVDVPQVIGLRRALYDDAGRYRMIVVSDRCGMARADTDGSPRAGRAEGPLMYLSESEIRQLLQRLTDRFGTGELLADLVPSWVPRLSRVLTSGIVKCGSRDGYELAQWNQRLDLIEVSEFLDPANIPLRPQRTLYRLLAVVPAIRNYDRLYRFQF